MFFKNSNIGEPFEVFSQEEKFRSRIKSYTPGTKLSTLQHLAPQIFYRCVRNERFLREQTGSSCLFPEDSRSFCLEGIYAFQGWLTLEFVYNHLLYLTSKFDGISSFRFSNS